MCIRDSHQTELNKTLEEEEDMWLKLGDRIRRYDDVAPRRHQELVFAVDQRKFHRQTVVHNESAIWTIPGRGANDQFWSSICAEP